MAFPDESAVVGDLYTDCASEGQATLGNPKGVLPLARASG